MPVTNFKEIVEGINLSPSASKLTDDEARIFKDILTHFVAHCYGAKHQVMETIQKDLTAISEFTRFTGRPPWRWTEEDYDRWCLYKTKQSKVSYATLRAYQNSIHKFLDKLLKTPGDCNAIKLLFGVRPRQIITDENRLRHVGQERKKVRVYQSQNEIERFFEAIDDEIRHVRRIWRQRYQNPATRPYHVFHAIWLRPEGERGSRTQHQLICRKYRPATNRGLRDSPCLGKGP